MRDPVFYKNIKSGAPRFRPRIRGVIKRDTLIKETQRKLINRIVNVSNDTKKYFNYPSRSIDYSIRSPQGSLNNTSTFFNKRGSIQRNRVKEAKLEIPKEMIFASSKGGIPPISRNVRNVQLHQRMFSLN